MNKLKKVKYGNEPIGKIKVIRDFLPNPRHLVMKEKTVKVTLALTQESIDFFKEEAESHHTHYQKMIRNLLDQYAAHYSKHHRNQ